MKALILSLLAISSVASADVIDNYNFDTATQAYQSSPGLQKNDSPKVMGMWKLVAVASRSYKGDFAKADPHGLANQDGTFPMLGIQLPPAGELHVSIINLGANGLNQGPNELIFAPGGYMTFAQYAYKNGVMNDDVYFLPECRLYAADSLLCAKRFYVNRPEKVNEQQRSLHNKIVGYDLYRKQQ